MPTTTPQTLDELIFGFQAAEDGRVRGVVICGMRDRALIDQIVDALPPMTDGFEPPIYCIEPNERTADACIVSGETALSDRVSVFSGDDCETGFYAACKSRIGLSLPNQVIAADADNIQVRDAVKEGLKNLQNIQVVFDASIRARLQSLSSARQIVHWRERYQNIQNGSAAARVMVVTSRYTTYVRHSAEDLARAFRDLGHDATVLMEPDSRSILTTSYYLQGIEAFDPDLIVCINYPRSARGGDVPDGWPYVCWVQDAMPHLFTGGAGTVGTLDFIAGHVYDSAAEHAGYPGDHTLRHAVCASEAKFHAAPVDNRNHGRFDCDIAYLSHRSDPPREFHERFIAGSGLQPDAARAFHRCADAIDDVIRRWATEGGYAGLSAAVQSLAHDLGNPDEQRFADLLNHQYVHPYAELTIRRETLRWAAEISKSDGLSMRVYGNGWDQDPEFAPFAAGPIEHGEELRACYQSAGAHLHASVLGSGHQRVFECALSGGLPLCRRSLDELWQHDWIETRSFILREVTPDVWFYRPRWPAHIIANHPELMEMARRRQLLPPPPNGWDHEYLGAYYAQIVYDENNKPNDAPVPPEYLRPIRLLGDPLELTFSTKQELRERINRAATRPRWRDSLSNGIASRAKQNLSTKRFAERLLQLVGGALLAQDTPDTTT